MVLKCLKQPSPCYFKGKNVQKFDCRTEVVGHLEVLLILKPLVRVVFLHKSAWPNAIFLSNVIILGLSVCSPFVSLNLSFFPFPLKLGLFFLVLPLLFGLVPTAAAVDTAAGDGQDNGSSNHTHGDQQGLVVQPANSPSGIRKVTVVFVGNDLAHWVGAAFIRPGGAPQTCRVFHTFLTTAVDLGTFLFRGFLFSCANKIWRQCGRLALNKASSD